MRRIGCIVVILVVVGVGLLAALRVKALRARGQRASGPQAIPVEVRPVTRSDLVAGAEVTGTLATDEKVAIASKIPGRVEFVAAREGQPVRAGQVVVKLDDRDVAAQVQQAKAALEAARVRLAQAGTAAQMQTTRSGTDVAQAEAALAAAQAQLAALRSGARPQERKLAEYAVAQAKSGLDNAETNYQRMKDLFAKGAVSQQALDASRLQYDIARSQYDTAQQQLSLVRAGPRQEEIDAAEQRVKQAEEALRMAEAATAQIELSGQDIKAAHAAVAQSGAAQQAAELQLGYAIVRTPISGVVSQRDIEPGEMAGPGSTLLTVVNNRQVYLRAQLSERELHSVRVGAPAQVTVDAAGAAPVAGRVAEILPAANQGNLTFTVKIRVPNPKGLFKDGMFGRATIVTERRQGVVAIPRQAVVTAGGRTAAFIVRDGKAVATPVTLGLEADDRVQVVSGLAGGEQLIVRGQDSLSGGERVAVKTGGSR